ncbi:uncharacterized protein TNCV_2734941 [Trichonephila clavipes]|nr:uncharacterized protein TNCV_2734941 [Trichonephila clavipes]
MLGSDDITRMDWQAYSPDLNPIEQVWDALGRCIAARLHHPENTQQLKQMLIEEWALLPQEILHQLVLIFLLFSLIQDIIYFRLSQVVGSEAVGSLVVRASDSRPEGLGSMLDVTKYPPSAHGFTCRNCGGGDRGRVAIYSPFGEVSLSLNRTVTCMVLKANDRRTSCPCHDEFHGPRSDYVRQVALATKTQYIHK